MFQKLEFCCKIARAVNKDRFKLFQNLTAVVAVGAWFRNTNLGITNAFATNEKSLCINLFIPCKLKNRTFCGLA